MLTKEHFFAKKNFITLNHTKKSDNTRLAYPTKCGNNDFALTKTYFWYELYWNAYHSLFVAVHIRKNVLWTVVARGLFKFSGLYTISVKCNNFFSSALFYGSGNMSMMHFFCSGFVKAGKKCKLSRNFFLFDMTINFIFEKKKLFNFLPFLAFLIKIS